MAWQPSATLETVRARARLYQQIRAFFAASDCLEVETPLLSSATNTDPNINSIRARELESELFLQTSPEFAMKRLLAAGYGSIYQICHAFREAEFGRNHRREFSLLEWYRVDYDYQQLMDEIENLIDLLSGQSNSFQRITYRGLLQDNLGLDVFAVSLETVQGCCYDLLPGTDSQQLEFDECLDLLLSLVVAPSMQGYWFVYDYPVSQASLARVSPRDNKVAERFELFHNHLELANGFSELTDPLLQRKRFEADNQQRMAKGQETYPIDEALLAALAAGLPACAGVALGLDRLLMVLFDLDSIESVINFD